MDMDLFGMPDMIFTPEQPRIAFPDPQIAPKQKVHRKNVLNHVSCTLFYAEFEFHIGLSQNSLPGVENQGFPIL